MKTKLIKTGVNSWSISREGKPIVQIRDFEGFNCSSPSKILSKDFPIPAALKALKILHKYGEITDKDLFYLSRQVIKIARSEKNGLLESKL